MLSAKKVKLDYLPLPGAGLSSKVVVNHVQQTFLEPFVGRVHSRVAFCYAKLASQGASFAERKAT